MLLVVSLVTAVAGAALGLFISFLQELQLERREILSDFSMKSAAFAQRLNPGMIESAASMEEETSNEFRTYLHRINYTFTETAESRVTLFRKTGGEPPLELAFDLSLTPTLESDEDTFLNELISEATSADNSVIFGFAEDEKTFQGASSGIRSLFG